VAYRGTEFANGSSSDDQYPSCQCSRSRILPRTVWEIYSFLVLGNICHRIFCKAKWTIRGKLSPSLDSPRKNGLRFATINTEEVFAKLSLGLSYHFEALPLPPFRDAVPLMS
jgi:hypothetical protein